MKSKIVVAPGYTGLLPTEEILAPLREHFEVVGTDQIGEAIGALGLNPTKEMLDKASHLKAIATISAGYDGYDLDDLSRRGILLMNCPDSLTETTADLAFTLLAATARRVVELAEYVKEGKWAKPITSELFATDVHGATLGIVGMGRIGAAVARRGALGFGMKILYSGPSAKPQAEKAFGAERRSLEDLLKESDFVCLAMPLKPDTAALIGRAELASMKPSAILVNIARGGVVDEKALIEALESGKIGGAGLDVFEKEPLSVDSKLLQLPNVVALPHVGSATQKTRDDMAKASVDNLIQLLVNGRLVNVVNSNAKK